MATAKSKIQWEGPASLKRLLIPTEECVPHPENPRVGNLDVIEESLRAFGQVRPILINTRSGYIVAGNHTYRAAVERLGWNRIAVVKADLSPEDERRYLIADNRTSDVGEYDEQALAKILVDLAEADKLIGTGYSGEDVDELMVQAERAIAEANPLPDDGSEDDERPPLSASRHVVLMFDPKAHEKFGRYLSMLSRELDTDGPSETVYRVIEQAAKDL